MAEPKDSSGSGSGSAGFVIQAEYATYRLPARVVTVLCELDPQCLFCGKESGSGSGGSGGVCAECASPAPDWYTLAVALDLGPLALSWPAYCAANCDAPGFGVFPGDCVGVSPSNDFSIVPAWFSTLNSSADSNGTWLSVCEFMNGVGPYVGDGGSGVFGPPSVTLEYVRLRFRGKAELISTRCVEVPYCTEPCP